MGNRFNWSPWKKVETSAQCSARAHNLHPSDYNENLPLYCVCDLFQYTQVPRAPKPLPADADSGDILVSEDDATPNDITHPTDEKVAEGTHHKCANRGGYCQCYGKARIGRHNNWSAWKEVSGSIKCTKMSFGMMPTKDVEWCQCESKSVDPVNNIGGEVISGTTKPWHPINTLLGKGNIIHALTTHGPSGESYTLKVGNQPFSNENTHGEVIYTGMVNRGNAKDGKLLHTQTEPKNNGVSYTVKVGKGLTKDAVKNSGGDLLFHRRIKDNSMSGSAIKSIPHVARFLNSVSGGSDGLIFNHQTPKGHFGESYTLKIGHKPISDKNIAGEIIFNGKVDKNSIGSTISSALGGANILDQKTSPGAFGESYSLKVGTNPISNENLKGEVIFNGKVPKGSISGSPDGDKTPPVEGH